MWHRSSPRASDVLWGLGSRDWKFYSDRRNIRNFAFRRVWIPISTRRVGVFSPFGVNWRSNSKKHPGMQSQTLGVLCSFASCIPFRCVVIGCLGRPSPQRIVGIASILDISGAAGLSGAAPSSAASAISGSCKSKFMAHPKWKSMVWVQDSTR